MNNRDRWVYGFVIATVLVFAYIPLFVGLDVFFDPNFLLGLAVVAAVVAAWFYVSR